MKKFKAFATLGLASIALAACGAQTNETVKVGVVGDTATQIWENVAERAAEEGITVEVVTFSDYTQPNRALEDGELDLNAFQHTAFLADYVAENDSDLVPIGYTFISPMGMYATEEITDVESIPDGASIAIPNDPTNGGRALLLLEAAGLIEVDDAASYTPTVDDITANDKNLTIDELDAAQVPRALGDDDLVIANTNYAVDAGFVPREDAIYIDTDHMDKVNDVYKNTIVAKSENADSETFQKVVELYQSDETKELIAEFSADTDMPIWAEGDDPQADFQTIVGE
jgi:D-methionine transport system substrate-binding protein